MSSSLEYSRNDLTFRQRNLPPGWLQTLCFLEAGKDGQAILCIAFAAQMAQSIGLHRSLFIYRHPREIAYILKDHDLRNRIWWTCYCLDKYVGFCSLIRFWFLALMTIWTCVGSSLLKVADYLQSTTTIVMRNYPRPRAVADSSSSHRLLV